MSSNPMYSSALVRRQPKPLKASPHSSSPVCARSRGQLARRWLPCRCLPHDQGWRLLTIPLRLLVARQPEPEAAGVYVHVINDQSLHLRARRVVPPELPRQPQLPVLLRTDVHEDAKVAIVGHHAAQLSADLDVLDEHGARVGPVLCRRLRLCFGLGLGAGRLRLWLGSGLGLGFGLAPSGGGPGLGAGLLAPGAGRGCREVGLVHLFELGVVQGEEHPDPAVVQALHGHAPDLVVRLELLGDVPRQLQQGIRHGPDVHEHPLEADARHRAVDVGAGAKP
mmetsp:Transcript_125529/g.366676  ORF Transcript_125529/g.366676 Transcript_125529/m.366676 type:complete len:280 (-) Transcript_125529:838-1677(-)